MIFSGKVVVLWLNSKVIGEIRGIEYAPIKFELADDLSIGVQRYLEKY